MRIDNWIQTQGRIKWRYWFAGAGLCFAQGAPLGYFVHQAWLQRQSLQDTLSKDLGTLVYIWLGTSFFFGVFTFLVGYLFERIAEKNRSLHQAILVNESLSRSKQELVSSMIDDVRTPLSVAIEFLDSLQGGHFGPTSVQQNELSRSVIQELKHLDRTVSEILQFKRLKSSTSNGGKTLPLLPLVQKNLELNSKIAIAEFKGPSKEISAWTADPALIELAVDSFFEHAQTQSQSSEHEVELNSGEGSVLLSRFPDLPLDPVTHYSWMRIYSKKEPAETQSAGEKSLLLDTQSDQFGSHPIRVMTLNQIAEWHNGHVWVSESHELWMAFQSDSTESKKSEAA